MNLSATRHSRFWHVDGRVCRVDRQRCQPCISPVFVKRYAPDSSSAWLKPLRRLIGWGIGLFASQYIMEWDHWVAFSLLFILGMRMIVEGVRNRPEEEEKVKRHGFWLLVATAIATSLDAMAIGVGLAFLQVNIVHTAMAIGMATMIMATLGMMIGRFIGPLLGKRAEILGGVVLIAIGVNILLEHLGYLA
jgi:manganese efflux pump family protein